MPSSFRTERSACEGDMMISIGVARGESAIWRKDGRNSPSTTADRNTLAALTSFAQLPVRAKPKGRP